MCWLIPQIKNLFVGQIKNDIMSMRIQHPIHETYNTTTSPSWLLSPLIHMSCVLFEACSVSTHVMIVTRPVFPRHHVARLLAPPRHWLQLLDRHLGERDIITLSGVSANVRGPDHYPLIIWSMVSTFCSIPRWKLGSAHLTIELLSRINLISMKTRFHSIVIIFTKVVI